MKRILSLLSISILFLLLVVGCGGDNNENNTQNNTNDANNEIVENENNEENNSEGEEEAGDGTRVIVDQAGREVELPAKVDRTITTWGPATNILFSIGGQSKLVAVDNHSTKNEFFLGIYPEIGDTPGIGNRRGLNIEEMIAAKPDVVFLWVGEDTEHIASQLEQQGIPAFFIVPESAEDMKQATLLMGEVLNLEEQAQAAIDYYEDTIALVQEKISHVSAEDRPVVYFSGSGGLLNTMGKDYYQHYIIEQAGGRNAAEELEGYGWQDVSPEQVVAWNPDYILVTQMVDEDFVNTIKSNPGLSNINAVKNEELYLFPSNIATWDFPTPISAMGILWLANTLYPDEFADFDFEEEVENYHKQFFGKGFTELGGNLDETGRQSLD